MRFLILGMMAAVLAGCATREVGTVRPAAYAATETRGSAEGCQRPKVVWVTIDGTSNTPVSRTAAARLHEMVETYSYTPPTGHPLAIWYAEGVGSADLDLGGKALGIGVDDDIRKAYAFLTQVWKPCDRLFFNGFSRGAYSVRVLGGLLYMAGIPDLSGMDTKARGAIVGQLFDAYKTSGGNARRAERIARVYARHDLKTLTGSRRAAGFDERDTGVIVEAMTIWDSVQALGLPDRSEDPTEGPPYFLLTACNVRAIFPPLALDDNRAYSFTPILAGGLKATAACRDGGQGRQDVSRVIKEFWFSGAHADVGGTYETKAAMLDGELASISLNWVIGGLNGPDCPGCGAALALPAGLTLPEDRLTAVHDGKKSSKAYRGLFRQNRKPSAYWAEVYGKNARIAVHASVFDRLKWLFALDAVTPGCNRADPPNIPVQCAREIASYGLVPELLKVHCLEPGAWGYRLTDRIGCVDQIGTPSSQRPVIPASCRPDEPGEERGIPGLVYKDELPTGPLKVVPTDKIWVAYSGCRTGHCDDERTTAERPIERSGRS